MEALTVRGLRKAYGGKPVLRGVNLTVHRGAVHGLLGPTGSGKGLVLGALLGLVRPDAGEARLLGAAPGALDARQRAGFLPPEPRFPPRLDARELLCCRAALHGLPRAARRERAEEVLELVGLTDARGRLAGFDRGMRQRLGLAAALLPEPEVALLYEPLAGLDPVAEADARALIASLPREGTTVLLATRALPVAEALCHKVTLLDRGAVRAEGTPGEVAARFGGATVLVLELADPNPEARLAVARLPCVVGVEGDAQRFRVTVRDAGDHRAEVARTLARHGALVLAMAQEEVGLEEAFLHLVEAPPGGGPGGPG